MNQQQNAAIAAREFESAARTAWSQPELKPVGTLRDVAAIVQAAGFDTKNNHGS